MDLCEDCCNIMFNLFLRSFGFGIYSLVYI